ncbi:MAG: DUF4139 domain-containing protein [Gemmataceae bacterium]|nr:DUF4139 domain-containing protein [Gemmataceae bacterium]MCI0740647.1 DUF4139 domain-containing protein [Gemmataceae bacterium]
MRRTWKLFALAGAGLLAAAVVWRTTSTSAQDNGGKPKAVADSPLPIKQVVLFNSGVGYFQREGDVDGNARLDLTFPARDINDLLKSLVLQDLGGGKISSVNYDSHDPIDKILRSFALDLTANPTFGQILNQARGEKIEILRQEKKDGQYTKQTGIIIGMEVQHKPVGKDGGVVEYELLNLSGVNGLEAIPLEQVHGVKFLNPVLENEFQRALKVLASSHDLQKKSVSLGFNGPGKRAVRVGYVVERPIWKTTYRLRLEPNGKLFIQGWALVENTSDDDWNDVRMVLVSGKPISYQMNLYEPLYIPRPFVEPEMFASLRPPVYSGAMGPDEQAAGKRADAVINQMQRGQMPPGFGQMGAGAPPVNFPGGSGGIGGFGGQLGGFGYFPGQMGQFGGAQFGQQGGINRYQDRTQEFLNYQQNFLQNKLTYEDLQQRRQKQQEVGEQAKKVGSMVAGLNFKEGIQSVATAEEIGDYYQYIIDQKINLARQKSAMLPILDQTIDGAKVSIYNESTHTKYPLLGLKLKNTSGQPLTQGPITVYDNTTYAGDTRILDLQPNEERLLSYALDQSTEVKTDTKASPSPDMNFKIDSAQLTAKYKLRQTRTYTIKNRSTHNRTVILEHPIRGDWKLIDPAKPIEKSRDVYRFSLAVAAGKTETFDVVEEQARLDSFGLTKVGDAPLYAVGLGIEVKPEVHKSEPKLTGLKIEKGFLLPTLKLRESKTYFVQNLSEQDRNFTVDHIVRQDWVRLFGDETQRGPAVYRFILKVAKGKTGQQEIVEERTYTEKGRLIKDVSEKQLRDYLASAVPSADVKAGLTKALALSAKVIETSKQLASSQKHMDEMSKDQARMRDNLKIIPPTSEHHKKFLEKFVAQETEIETLQRQIRTAEVTLLTQQREYDAFIANLNAD